MFVRLCCSRFAVCCRRRGLLVFVACPLRMMLAVRCLLFVVYGAVFDVRRWLFPAVCGLVCWS